MREPLLPCDGPRQLTRRDSWTATDLHRSLRRGSSTTPVTVAYSPTRANTYYGRSYGGRGVYYINGNAYQSGGQQNYLYGAAVFAQFSTILIVGSEGYGCYSCAGAARTCTNCPSDCFTREGCAGERTTDVQSSHDRYELPLAIRVPETESSRWPLKMLVYNATQFASRGSAHRISSRGSDVFISFFTDEGDSEEGVNNLRMLILVDLAQLWWALAIMGYIFYHEEPNWCLLQFLSAWCLCCVPGKGRKRGYHV